MTEVTKHGLPKHARKVLRDLLADPGELIYSSHETLAPGSLYLLGLNPGGSDPRKVGEHIDQMLDRTDNSFLDEEWTNRQKKHAAGEAPLQKRVRWLLKALGEEPESVCASNLIFTTSRDADSMCFGLAGICWPVHLAVLSLVRPKMIICFGNGQKSPYAFIKALCKGTEDEEFLYGKHTRQRAKCLRTEIDGHKVVVVGLAHLSRFNVIGEAGLVGWIRERLT